MPQVSQRGESVSASPIRSLVPYARAAETAGKTIYYLNIGQPDILTPPKAIQALRNFDEEIIKYGSSEGLFSLRSKLVEYYKRFEVSIEATDVYVTTGASEAISLTLFSSFDIGDEVIIPEPFYANYIGFTQMSGVTIVPITSTIDQKFALPSIDEFEKVITPRTKAIFLCNPSNPTGQLYSQEDLEKLSMLVKERDLYLIVDEVYREFCYETEFYSVLNLENIKDQTIVIDSISKVFSCCGARVGYIVTRNQALKNVVEKYAQMRLCPPMIGQRIAEACYDSFDTYFHDVKDEYRKRRNYLYERLNKIDGVKTYKPNAAFYNIVELPVDDAMKFCKWMLEHFSYENQSVMMAPADGFYSHKSIGKRQVRIAYVLSIDKLEKAIDCLEQGLTSYIKQVMQAKAEVLG